MAGVALSSLVSAAERVLTRVSEVSHLSRVEAEKGIPVQLRGTVTYLEPNGLVAFLQDETGGIYFKHHSVKLNRSIDAEQGDEIEIQGITTPGRFAPYVVGGEDWEPVRAARVGSGEWPGPRRLASEELLNPVNHSQWIELRGSIRGRESIEGYELIQIGTSAGDFVGKVRTLGQTPWRSELTPGALVRVQGVFGSLFNQERELTGLRLFIPSPEFVRLEDAGGEALWSLPIRDIASLLQFEPPIAPRVRIQGVVLGHSNQRTLFVRDETEAIRVLSPNAHTWRIGDRVDLVGRVTEGNGHGVLTDAFGRRLSKNGILTAREVSAQELSTGAWEGDLVQVRGRMLDYLSHPQQHVLLIQFENIFFRAVMPNKQLIDKALPPVGSVVSVAGICEHHYPSADTRFDSGPLDSALTSGFTLLIQSEQELTVLQPPPFLTTQRVQRLLALVLVSLGGALIWVRSLRAKVQSQTQLIRDTLLRENTLSERSRIARELHDTLEQDLAGVALHLDTAARHLDSKPEAAQSMLGRARKLLRYSRQEAKRSVMELRSTALEQGDFEAALRCLFVDLYGNDADRVTVSVTRGESRLNPRVEHELLRIIQEAVNNAFEHGSADSIAVTIEKHANQMLIEVRDSGCGFDLEETDAAGAHYGILGMQERAAQLGGELKIESKRGTGTLVCFRLPCEDHEGSAV